MARRRCAVRARANAAETVVTLAISIREQITLEGEYPASGSMTHESRASDMTLTTESGRPPILTPLPPPPSSRPAATVTLLSSNSQS